VSPVAPFTVQDIVRATHGALVAGDLGIPVTGVSIDSRSLAVGEAFFAIHGHRLDGHTFLPEAAARGAACLVVHTLPDEVPANVPLVLVEDTTRALGRLGAWHRGRFTIPVVAVTGSNGKSTTTALAGAMLRGAGFDVEVCGNIGEPLVDRVEGPPDRVFVVELSSFQIEGIATFTPKAAALLNLAEDHLDRYASMEEYAAAKRALFRNMAAGDVAVLNSDAPATLATPTAAGKRLFSRRGPVADGCFADAAGVVLEVAPGTSPVELFRAADVPLAGVQNLENAMAAALLARAVGAAPEGIRAGLAGFRGLPHRMEKVGESGGVAWYDDSKGTNPAATAKSLEGFADGTVHLILGGRNKGADLASLAPLVAAKARRVYLIGEAASDFERALGPTAPYEHAGTLDGAVRAAAGRARPGEVVVLSPACASFDQFRNFVHRGEVFKDLVRRALGAGSAGA
jgi:UDP-N-acetylmuramoylalanine--D-glutamate ligase